MTSKEFVIWLQGFSQGVHEYNVSPKQWDALKEKLAEVNDEPIGVPIGVGGTGVPNTHPFPTWQHPHYVEPYNPYKITSHPGTTITTTPGGSIGTITTPNGMSTGTTYGYPSGSAWSYTSTQTELTSERQLLTDNID